MAVGEHAPERQQGVDFAGHVATYSKPPIEKTSYQFIVVFYLYSLPFSYNLRRVLLLSLIYFAGRPQHDDRNGFD
jgi:hypothetical protein